MAIEKKLIHFGKLADFEAQLTAGNILDRSIVFIQDAKKIWTHGTYYDCSEGTATGDIVQSDWNENDPVSDSYIQGRTHYSYDVEQIALFSIASKNEGDILVTGLYVGGFYKLYNQAGGKSQDFHFVEGRKVPIPSVGPPIEAVCTYEDDYCLKLTTSTYGMNESFSLREMYVEQLKDIYVPETIARTSELKTINGESILGSGDITISGGGSSSGSGAYSEVNHGTNDTTFALTPNTFHVWDEVANLTLTLGSETAGVANEFLFQFNSGSNATTLTMSDDIKWTEELVIEPNRIYQVSILKGLASVLSWENGPNLFPVTLVVGEQNQINADVYNYLYNTYGAVTTTLKEDLSFDRDGVIVDVSLVQYGTYEGYTGYWLNGYVAANIKVVLLSDGSLIKRFPIMPEEN